MAITKRDLSIVKIDCNGNKIFEKLSPNSISDDFTSIVYSSDVKINKLSKRIDEIEKREKNYRWKNRRCKKRRLVEPSLLIYISFFV